VLVVVVGARKRRGEEEEVGRRRMAPPAPSREARRRGEVEREAGEGRRGGIDAFRCLLWRRDPEASVLSRLLCFGWLVLVFFFLLVFLCLVGSALLQLEEKVGPGF
jgi:hypothetical protein